MGIAAVFLLHKYNAVCKGFYNLVVLAAAYDFGVGAVGKERKSVSADVKAVLAYHKGGILVLVLNVLVKVAKRPLNNRQQLFLSCHFVLQNKVPGCTRVP